MNTVFFSKRERALISQTVFQASISRLQVGEATGVLHNFIVEPFVPHEQNEEGYICIYSKRDHDAILFTHEGGIDIGNVEDKAKSLIIPVGQEDTVNPSNVKDKLLSGLDPSKHERVGKFITVLYEVYRRQYFTYLEVNPLVITSSAIYMLDFAAKVKISRIFTFFGVFGQFLSRFG